jgi:hypothetical protein
VKVILCKVGQKPEVAEIEHTTEGIQKAIGGGYFEIVRPKSLPGKMCFVCDEDGVHKGLPVNIIGTVLYGYAEIVGDIFITKEGYTEDGIDFVSLTDEDIKTFMEGRIEFR